VCGVNGVRAGSCLQQRQHVAIRLTRGCRLLRRLRGLAGSRRVQRSGRPNLCSARRRAPRRAAARRPLCSNRRRRVAVSVRMPCGRRRRLPPRRRRWRCRRVLRRRRRICARRCPALTGALAGARDLCQRRALGGRGIRQRRRGALGLLPGARGAPRRHHLDARAGLKTVNIHATE